MNKEQKRLAAQAISEIVREATYGREPLENKALKKLAKAAAKALAAGFKQLNKAS